MQNYPEAQWVVREQERLRNAIAHAAGEGIRNDEGPSDDHAHLEIHRKGDRPEAGVAGVQGARATTSRELSHRARCAGAVPELLGPGGDGGAILADLLDLFEQSAANGTPIREVVGEDPVAFIEAFIQTYPEGHWRARERERFINAIERIEQEEENR